MGAEILFVNLQHWVVQTLETFLMVLFALIFHPHYRQGFHQALESACFSNKNKKRKILGPLNLWIPICKLVSWVKSLFLLGFIKNCCHCLKIPIHRWFGIPCKRWCGWVECWYWMPLVRWWASPVLNSPSLKKIRMFVTLYYAVLIPSFPWW